MDQIKQDTLDLLQELRAADWDSALSGEHGTAEDVKISEKFASDAFDAFITHLKEKYTRKENA